MKLIPRRAAARLDALLSGFPCVLVHGPRQCGKSTLVRHALSGWRWLDLERERDRSVLSRDIEGFFQANPRHVVLDEASTLPQLFTALRPILDEDLRPGRFVLLGSASPSILRKVSESLAGRIGILELTPFRCVELAGGPHASDRWFWGGFPPVHRQRSRAARADWLESYLTTFVQRDVPGFGYDFPPERLRRLLTMLTHVHGSLLNLSDLARSLGVTAKTVAGYLDVLEGAFLIRRLPPHFANVRKRLTRSPKLYLRDTGLLHHLANLESPEELDTWPRLGQSFEGLVIEEVAILASERIGQPYLAFWRTQAGAEVDLLLGQGQRLVPIEIKAASHLGQYDLAGLRNCMKDLALQKGYIVYRGDEFFALGRDIEVVPWNAVASGDFDFGLGKRRHG